MTLKNRLSAPLLYWVYCYIEVSILLVNCEKTRALWIVAKKALWVDGEVLGVWFCIGCEESKKKNYEEKVRTR